mmetsp:Transcript_39700/g.97283  ORF Transcript_39700/g.97283 Transcript_39700/m.97283 type:complete len:267 (+) Transcript_39700:99-899(+)
MPVLHPVFAALARGGRNAGRHRGQVGRRGGRLPHRRQRRPGGRRHHLRRQLVVDRGGGAFRDGGRCRAELGVEIIATGRQALQGGHHAVKGRASGGVGVPAGGDELVKLRRCVEGENGAEVVAGDGSSQGDFVEAGFQDGVEFWDGEFSVDVRDGGGGDLIDCDGKGVDVCGEGVGCTAENFRGEVYERTDHVAEATVGRPAAEGTTAILRGGGVEGDGVDGEVKVGDDEVAPVGSEEDVGGLEIAVENGARVEVLHAAGELEGEL